MAFLPSLNFFLHLNSSGKKILLLIMNVLGVYLYFYECTTIQSEVSNLLRKSVIVETHHDPGEFIPPIFVRPKKDGTTRMILNLQFLKEHVVYLDFKMNTLKDAISLMKPNCFMASIDLKDAYYSVYSLVIPVYTTCVFQYKLLFTCCSVVFSIMTL